ncbi:MAG: hypothetical protein FJ358_06605 [Thaumarchaeota archaeon]|nr:hypothetical protein [Nitrososphaerota archaeon]
MTKEGTIVNPRSVHRHLVLAVEELGYMIRSSQDESFTIQKEALGESTGTLTSRIGGVKNTEGAGYISYGYVSRIVMAVLTVVAVIGLALSPFGLLVTAAVAPVGYLVWKRSLKTVKFKVLQQSRHPYRGRGYREKVSEKVCTSC